MARIKIIRGTNLPDSATKEDCHNLVDDATAQIYDIIGSEVKSDAAIVDTKLATISTIGKVNLTALVCASQAAGDILYINNAGSVVRLPIGTAGQKLRVGNTQVDYMEYATNLLAATNYVSNAATLATGGTITTDGLYKVHTFTSSGTFTPANDGVVDVLVVGGGGGGGCNWGGGGGGGGVVYTTGKSITAQAYSVTVGAGAAAKTSTGQGDNGSSSIFDTITAAGGGGGGIATSGQPESYQNGKNGGCGGGAGTAVDSGANAVGGTGSQGYDGGDCTAASGNGACGGGGAGGAGGVNTASGGAGGIGYTCSISGSSVDYAGGGGGGDDSSAGAGNDGGGAGGGSGEAGTAGTANTGGGGGGGGSLNGNGGAGGSGIVIIRYLTNSQSALQVLSEASIKNQGSYSLKAIATITSSLNKTLTRTVSPTLDLTGETTLKFDIRSSRTGSNIKIGIHDSGGTTTEITPNVTSANAWQTVTWDISGVSDANKNVIDSIIITVVNADATNTFYLDNFLIYGSVNVLRWVTP